MATPAADAPQWPPKSGKADRGPPKAGFRDAIKPNQYYFFAGDSFIASIVATDKIVEGPKKITDGWKSLAQCQFDQIDAVLPDPLNVVQAYFFYGEWCALINIDKRSEGKDFVVQGPVPIGTFFPLLPAIGFNTTDACIPISTSWNDAYFFKGDTWARLGVVLDQDILKTKTDLPPVKAPRSTWPTIGKSSFAYLDTIILADGDSDIPSLPEATKSVSWYLSVDKYSKIELGANGASDTLLGGPSPIAPNWPGLASAKFY